MPSKKALQVNLYTHAQNINTRAAAFTADLSPSLSTSSVLSVFLKHGVAPCELLDYAM